MVGKNQLVLPIGYVSHFGFYFKNHVKPMNGVKPEVYWVSRSVCNHVEATKRSYQDEKFLKNEGKYIAFV